MSKRLNQTGFTIIELMIATIVFSGILLGATTILLQISKLYYGGVTATQTQDATRMIMNDVAQQIQFSNASVQTASAPITGTAPSSLTSNAICVGNQRYSFVLDGEYTLGKSLHQWDTADHKIANGLWRDTIAPGGGTCQPLDLTNPNPSSGGQELLAPNMRVSSFYVLCNDSHRCIVTVAIAYGDDELLNSATSPTGCKSSVSSQWCAFSQLSTQVYQRVHSGS